MDFILSNANIVTMSTGPDGYQVLNNQYIGVEKGKIKQIGTKEKFSSLDHVKVINCQNKLVTPGLIDCHTHLVFAGNRANEFEQRLTGVPYEQIAKSGGGILSTVHSTRNASESELCELALPRLQGLIRDGVTTVEIKSGYGLTLDDELKMLRVARQLEQHERINVSTTLLAAHALPPEYQNKADKYIDHVCETIIPQAAEEQLADYVDVFCEGIGFNLEQTRKVFEAAKQYGLGIKGHTEQLSNLGGSALAANMGASSVDHVEYLDQTGVKALAHNHTVATLLPGAFYFLRETQLPPIELLRKHNVPMAIATDFNPGTSPFASLTMMMNMACTLFKLTPEEALRGVTVHAAQALGLNHTKGQIVTGFDADLAIWDIEHPADLSYQVGIPRLHARLVNGEVCYAA